jgi:hypothetical protein
VCCEVVKFRRRCVTFVLMFQVGGRMIDWSDVGDERCAEDASTKRFYIDVPVRH